MEARFGELRQHEARVRRLTRMSRPGKSRRQLADRTRFASTGVEPHDSRCLCVHGGRRSTKLTIIIRVALIYHS